MIAYDTANNGLPGSLNQLGGTPIHSWAVAVLPNIGEGKRHAALMKEEFPAGVFAPVPALLCPSDNPREERRLNYVVNCGPSGTMPGITGDNAPHFTLFKDRRSDLLAINKKVKIEDIPNGMSNTILLSENVNTNVAGVWYDEDWDFFALLNELPISSSNEDTRSRVAVENLGFVWGRNNNLLPNSSDRIPRPSSKHPAVFVAAFADGTAKVINDDISLEDWLKAVCLDDEKARLPVSQGGLGW